MYKGVKAILAAGGLVSLAAAVSLRWLEFGGGGTEGGYHVPKMVLLATGGLFVLCWAVWAVGFLRLWAVLPGRGRLSCAALVLLGLLSFGGVWYAWMIVEGFDAWELRPAMRLVLFTQAVIWGSEAILAALLRLARWVRAKVDLPNRSPRQIALIAAVLAMVLTSILAVFILDGMPHMSDATGYLMQGKIYLSGRLYLDQPTYPELFWPYIHLKPRYDKFYHIGQAGWSMPLAVADALGVPWAANVLMTGLVVLLTYWVVSATNGQSMAALTALIVALTPWMWAHGSTQMTHVNSTVCLLLMLRGFWGVLQGKTARQQLPWAVMGGLALGWAVVVRLPDTVFFTLPVAVTGLIVLARRFRQMWLAAMVFLLASAPGIGTYLWINHAISGSAFVSTYGKRPDKIISQSARSFGSLWGFTAWLQESWARLNQHWAANAFPVAIPAGLGVWLNWKNVKRAWLFLLCSLALLLGYGLARFGSRPWVGPRWYAPLVPGLAFLVACGLSGAWERLRETDNPFRQVSERTLAWSTMGLLVALLLAVPLRWNELVHQPPHLVSDKVLRAVRQQSISNAVIALWGGEEGHYPPEALHGLKYEGKEIRAAIWTMKLPLEENNIIYVWRQPGWKEKASECWPEKKLYILSDKPGDYTFIPVEPERE